MNVFEKNEEPRIFQLGIDETAKAHLLETTRWTKFLAIMGILTIGLLLLIGVVSSFGTRQINGGSIVSTVVMLFYIILAIIYIYPVWALFKYSKLTKNGLVTSNQQMFNEGLRYQKSMFKFLGIIAIISIALSGLGMIIGFFAAVAANV